LADEYADELNNLGVRVSALENRVGNVKLTGDARIRYRYQSEGDKIKGTDQVVNEKQTNDNSWDYRVRIRANAQVNDRTKVTYGISTNSISFADNSTASNSDNNNIYTDLANVDYNFGGNNWDLLVGRYEYIMGGPRAYGFFYGDTFDGAQLKYQNDKFAATAGYGKFKEGPIGGYWTVDDDNYASAKTAYGELEGFFGGGRMAGSAVGVYYNNIMPKAELLGDDIALDNIDVWGAYASVNFGKWNALANYETYRDVIDNGNGSKDNADVWVGKLTYGAANFATPKSWDAWVEYLNADQFDIAGTFIGSTNGWRNDSLTSNVKSWGVGVDYTFAKNAQFQVMQSFASSAKDGDADPGEETRAQFVFVF
ncbi:outer membrane insertion signal, partial [Megasphaera elsdenii]|uniref:outer membrane insertion signal n=2 Tax=Megasphaera TaxID=906 RepID=UPI003FEDF4AF